MLVGVWCTYRYIDFACAKDESADNRVLAVCHVLDSNFN
jgi:hypothetical protein